MARTSNVFARVEPEVKEQAEVVLDQIGIPMSTAIGLFLRQVVLQRGIPFEMKLPSSRPLDMGTMSKEAFDAEVQKGMDSFVAGRTSSSADVHARMRASMHKENLV
ncbi:MAG: type II toxin-antitoxin system RelB/DinJ family antitoxin [Clostridia bacterium]